MILGLRYAPARYVENNLLTAVGAAEVLHRGLGIDDRPMPADEFKPMREAMLAHVPEDILDQQRWRRSDPWMTAFADSDTSSSSCRDLVCVP